MHDGPAEILVSATSQSCCDMPKTLGIFWQFSAAGDEKISYISHMITKWIQHTMKIAVTIMTFQHFEVPHDA